MPGTLNPCPFCGVALETLASLIGTANDGFQIACSGCGARGPLLLGADNAISAWIASGCSAQTANARTNRR